MRKSCDSETEDETIALRKKRSRRVSFADREITSVHIFNRDEDYETPPDSSSAAKKSNVSDGEEEVLGFFRDLGDSDDSKELFPFGDEEDEEDVLDSRKSFLRPVQSPSPGSSSVVGSATSNDEDNFFGPVSASFIRPGQLFDSVASDDNHDVTMDSTAFSMHYRSLARSESGEGLKTPTTDCLVFEEKSPFDIPTPVSSSSMVLTKTKLLSQFPPPVEKVSGGRDSNDMSLVGENMRSYDYGKLSPELEALFAEGSKVLSVVPVSESVDPKPSTETGASMSQLNGSVHMRQKDCEDRNNDIGVTVDIYAEDVPKVNSDFNKAAIETDKLDFDFNAVSGNTDVDQKIDFARLTSFKESESGEHLTAVQNKNSPTYRIKNHEFTRDSSQQGAPLTGSVSFISTKPDDLFLTAAKSSRHLSYMTPSPRKPGFFLDKQNRKSDTSAASSQKSESRFKIFEPSPLTCSLRDGIENSKLRLSKFRSSAASAYNAGVEGNSKCSRQKMVYAPITNLEQHLYSCGLKSRDIEGTTFVDTDGMGLSNNVPDLSIDGGTIGLAENQEPLLHISACTLSKETGTEVVTNMLSSSQLIGSVDKVIQHNLMLKKPLERTLFTPPSDPILVETKLNPQVDMKIINGPERFDSPPVKSLDQNSLSTIYQDKFLTDLKMETRSDEFGCVKTGKDRNKAANVTDNDHFDSMTDKLKLLFAEGKADCNSPTLDTCCFQDLSEIKKSGDKPSRSPDLEPVSGSLLEISRTSSWDSRSSAHDSGSLNNIVTEAVTACCEEELPKAGKGSALASVSPNGCSQSANTSPLKSPTREKVTQSASTAEQTSASHGNNLHPVVGVDNSSLDSKLNRQVNVDSHIGLHNTLVQFPARYTENSSGRKRRIEDPDVGDAPNAAKIFRIKNNDIHASQGSVMEFMLQSFNGSDSESLVRKQDRTPTNWRDILVKLSVDAKGLLSSLVDKLHISVIAKLQEILAHLQKVKTYEMLYSQIQSQRSAEQSSVDRLKRAAEARMLMNKIIFEKARMQLMIVMREKLLKRSQLLNRAVQDCQMLKSNHTSLLSMSDKAVKSAYDTLLLANLGSKSEVSSKDVATMRHEFEVLNRNVINLTRMFHNYFKVKGDLSHSETLVVLHDFVKKRNSCRLMRGDLQLWELDDLEIKNGQLTIFINYHGFICQRLLISSVPSPSIQISNKLNDIYIMKNFPNTDASAALAHIVKAENAKKYAGSRSLLQETQVTCSLLHNLLDVVEEIQLARLEIRNLVETSFHSSSVEKLGLQLDFLDFNTCRKVKVTLDLACLKCGIYPSDVIPYNIEVHIAGEKKTLPELHSRAIEAAVDSLRIGFRRIIRLCRCISQVVQSLST
ncbi:hypothetical protein K2173_000560 [Erythroxylum novogranatense]|uniref:Uncharacterized protein n=1 Tax=Erythroxylum novogranatense TaxID=1862640 RepID=A0AAV8S7I6_9ROSI|nr:hypothetical protein K2173_000560 [Erythroxylum novogranatense]